jgi:hypothetical protein
MASASPFNRPHIESLLYLLDTDKTLAFDNPPPLDHETPDFRLRLEGDRLTVTMKIHFASVEEAKGIVDPFLHAWELDFALARGRREMRFKFDKPVIVDLERSPGQSPILLVGTAEMVTVTGSATLVVPLRNYPTPPSPPLKVTADVATLWDRYESSTLDREPLPGMGYFCLTIFEQVFGGAVAPSPGSRPPTAKRVAAAKALGVHVDVLRKLGELTTERGDAATARKAFPAAPLTNAEAEWIKLTLRELMRRAAMIAAGSSPSSQLTMNNLPALPP